MRYIVFKYGVDDFFDYVRSVTLQKVYNPNADSEENARLTEIYGLTVDEEDFFYKHCFKPACDEIFTYVKNHTFGTEPYGFNVLEDPLDPTSRQIVYYNMIVGGTQDTNVKNAILYAIRDYALMEWYKFKGEISLKAMYELEYNKTLDSLVWYTKGNNNDTENINVAKRKGIFN